MWSPNVPSSQNICPSWKKILYMSERKPSAVIEDILNCIEHIQSYTSGLSFEDFSSHFMTIEACLYNIQVIGEAVSLLPTDIKEDNSHVPWTLIKGMRS